MAHPKAKRLGFTAAVLIALVACAGKPSARVDLSATVESQVLARDQEYEEAWLRGDWNAVAGIVAPEYWGAGSDFSLDWAGLKEEFPKAKAMAYRNEAPHVKGLGPNLVLLNRVTTMRETYAGADISGRYWISEIWVRREGRWLLLVEQEIPLQPNPTANP